MAKGIYLGLPEDELLRYRAEALADLGRVVTSYSDSGTSVSKTFGMKAEDRLVEINWALSRLDPSKYGNRHTSITTDWKYRQD
jgi:hypothetical protein